jgi:hypothetical protein
VLGERDSDAVALCVCVWLCDCDAVAVLDGDDVTLLVCDSLGVAVWLGL